MMDMTLEYTLKVYREVELKRNKALMNIPRTNSLDFIRFHMCFILEEYFSSFFS